MTKLSSSVITATACIGVILTCLAFGVPLAWWAGVPLAWWAGIPIGIGVGAICGLVLPKKD